MCKVSEICGDSIYFRTRFWVMESVALGIKFIASKSVMDGAVNR